MNFGRPYAAKKYWRVVLLDAEGNVCGKQYFGDYGFMQSEDWKPISEATWHKALRDKKPHGYVISLPAVARIVYRKS